MPTDLNLIDAILLNTTRLGHGYAITKHPLVMKEVYERQIAIEISPISNQVLMLVRDLRNHPATILFANNFPVVITNDDPLMWGSKGLSYDFYEAYMAFASADADLRTLKQLAINSIVFSALSNDEKEIVMNIWEEKWDQFLDKMIRYNKYGMQRPM